MTAWLERHIEGASVNFFANGEYCVCLRVRPAKILMKTRPNDSSVLHKYGANQRVWPHISRAPLCQRQRFFHKLNIVLGYFFHRRVKFFLTTFLLPGFGFSDPVQDPVDELGRVFLAVALGDLDGFVDRDLDRDLLEVQHFIG